ncbi:MAG: TonB-dependent receptor [Mediterranea sp.]|nr:TonB-dependent receptor [Mediterranea sp.]
MGRMKKYSSVQRAMMLCMLFVGLMPLTLWAQTIQVTGTVLDATGETIIGASVLEKGTTNGAITDIDGKFSLAVKQGAELQVSFVGYVTQNVKVTGNQPLKIVLKEDSQALEEVVVIGYGTQKKSDVSGSVTTVQGDKLNKMPTANAEAALQGMAPGLAVNFGSGAAGSSASLQVRGVTSWGTDNSPLVIIDGVPGDMSYLNPEDIKSMSVLKDAATAAIYGARAAAGVILIETNRGTESKPKINFSAYWGMDDLPKKLDMCNSAEFIKVRKMALSNAGIDQSRWPAYIAAYEQNPAQFADTDWQDEYYRRGFVQKYNVGYTAGTEYSNVALSAFYSKEDAVVIGTGDEKFGFRLNSDVKRGKWKMGESISYSRWEADMESNSGFPGIYQVTNMEPLAPLYDANNDGGYGGAIAGMGMSDACNMPGYNNLVDYTSANDYISASGYLQFEPIKDLVIKAQAARSIYFGETHTFVPTYELGVRKTNYNASLTESRTKTINDLLELTANYSKTFNEVHSLQVLLGASQEEKKYNGISAYGQTFDNNDLDVLDQAQENYSVSGSKTRSGLRSVFGRLNYNYKMRYMLMASFRYDGSSRFADGNKWGFFPSVSLGWNIANEGFWENLKETVNALKLRLSYGGLGNQNIGLYQYIPTLTNNERSLNYPFDGANSSHGYAITELPSVGIKWETTIYKNIGIDMALWNNKLELSAEAYIKDTRDMLSTKNISLCTGFGSLTVNDGKLRTTGFEMQAIYHGSAGEFKYDLDMNLSHYKSKLKSMADPNYLYEYGVARTYVGGEIGEFWAYKTAGIFQSQAEVDAWNKQYGYTDSKGNWQPLQPSAKPGDIRFIDQNGDGLLDSNDKIKQGSGNPKVALAFNINLAYKNFDLVANFYGNLGVKRYNYTKYQMQRMDQNFNYGQECVNAWTPENPNTDIPRAVQGDPNGNSRISDRFIENGDYLRLNNLQLGYNLPTKLCKQWGINNLRFYIGGTRLFTITGYKGYDPSTGSTVGQMGVDYASSPLSRTYMAGIKFGF